VQTAGWNLGDIFDAAGEALPPDALALAHGEREVSWGALDRRTNNLARALVARGGQPGDKIALYLRNAPEYMETVVAGFKARLVHTNVNFRYRESELLYILDNSDAKFVVFSGEFADMLGKLRDRLPGVAAYLQIDDGHPQAPFAEPYESLAETGRGARLDIRRSPDDLLFLYTGGTTGMPKGVMWRAEDLWLALNRGANLTNANYVPADLADHTARLRRDGAVGRILPACPLMHGTGLFSSISALAGGSAVVTLPSVRLDAHELWATVERRRVTSIAIVGDAFAKPMLAALDEERGRYDLSSLLLIVSSGVMFTTEVKKRLLEHHPRMVILDSFGSSEAVGFGASVMTAQGEARTARFQIGDRVKVFSEDGREIQPGSGEPGFVARSGPIPLGYYKDAEKTASTFRTIGGVRYSIPGDWCTVEADGTLNLLGRGSVCINTAGEKVYPEEVEEVLKAHPAVYDALVVGVPDEKWGQAVTGVVEMRPGARFEEEELRSWVHGQLAGYKVPKHVLAVASVGRAPNGKADYKATLELAKRALGLG
jgi:fatty-acyl-CoA synthase